jgi:heme/copper-type cytochrome/quinol oxidase subunit 2
MTISARIRQALAFLLAFTSAWFVDATWAFAEPPAAAGAGGGSGDYMLSYMVVILGIVLGLLVVAKSSNRRDRERPAGYVEKNFTKD